MPTETDYAWAAGIIDGEGCIFIARKFSTRKSGTKTTNYCIGIKVTMGHEPTVTRLREMFGQGSSHTVQQVGWNPAYTWLAQAKICKAVLDCVEPYIYTKKDEVAVAKEFLALPGWHGGRYRGSKDEAYQQREYELWDRMRRLKPRTAFKLAKEEKADA